MTDWKTLPALFDRMALHPAAVNAADQRPVDDPWCIALSGGADSLALLLLVWKHWPERRSRMTALHFNHQLRGEASDGDERFCRDVCDSLSIAFVSARWEAPPEHPGEARAREARQAFFSREMMALGATVLWTGHQKDDIAETQLMRLARGAGPAGLAAPRPVSRHPQGRLILRPLLNLAKGEILSALTTAGVGWREDATNATRDYFRTRIRHEVLPRWQDAACANVLGGAALSRELCEEADEALDFWFKQLDMDTTGGRLDLRALRGLPRALWRRALRQWQPVAEMGRAGFESLLELCKNGGKGRLSTTDGFVDVEGGVVSWEPAGTPAAPWTAHELGEGMTVQLPDGAQLQARRVLLDEQRRKRILGGRVDASREAFLDGVKFPLVIRSWRAGDRFHPLGAPGSAKLQDLFVNRKIPVKRRGELPVVCTAENQVLWVPGFPPAEAAKVRDLTVEGVQLTYLRGTSTFSQQSNNPDV